MNAVRKLRQAGFEPSIPLCHAGSTNNATVVTTCATAMQVA